MCLHLQTQLLRGLSQVLVYRRFVCGVVEQHLGLMPKFCPWAQENKFETEWFFDACHLLTYGLFFQP